MKGLRSQPKGNKGVKGHPGNDQRGARGSRDLASRQGVASGRPARMGGHAPPKPPAKMGGIGGQDLKQWV